MYPRLFVLALGLLIFNAPALAQLKEIQVKPAITHAALPEGVGLNKLCGFDEGVVKSLADNTKRTFKINDKEDAAFQGRKMVLFTTNSTESGTASYKNPKWVVLAGELREREVVVGTFEFREELTYATLQDCDALKDLAYTFGKSIAWWLAEPARILTRVGAIMEVKKDSMDEGVRQSCSGDSGIPKYLISNGLGSVAARSAHFPDLKSYELQLSIEGSYIAGGSYFSGGKWLAVSGKLMDGDKLIGSFKGSRWTLGGYRLCSTLDYLTSYLGSDIIHWLSSPAMDSELGGK